MIIPMIMVVKVTDMIIRMRMSAAEPKQEKE
jgi:hypothetical protein